MAQFEWYRELIFQPVSKNCLADIRYTGLLNKKHQYRSLSNNHLTEEVFVMSDTAVKNRAALEMEREVANRIMALRVDSGDTHRPRWLI